MTRILPLSLLALTLMGCGGAPAPMPPADASPGPALAVERFLRAANENDLVTMMELFGTADRTIAELDGRAQAEQRMYVLATLLRHDDFAILSQQAVPGRMRSAVTLDVRLVRGDRAVVVPHVVVRKQSGGWIIERVAVEPLTQS